MNQWDYDDPEKVVTNKDLYELLGVARDATDSQIKRAYFKLAMVHHPDKRASNPEGSDEIFKEIGYAYKVLSDSEKRSIYDMGGADALEEQEGLANINLDQLLLNIMMWETGQKLCFLCVLFLFLFEVLILPLLVSLRLDGTLDWSWFGALAPLLIPLGLTIPCLVVAPVAIYRQYKASVSSDGAQDAQQTMQLRASILGCIAMTILVGCLASAAVMLCSKLDGDEFADSYTFQQAMIPLYILEGILAITLVGMPVKEAAESIVWKGVRVAFAALLAARLDGAAVPWVAVLSPLFVTALVNLALTLNDVRHHRRLKVKGKTKQ